jgi:hypothetical protein
MRHLKIWFCVLLFSLTIVPVQAWSNGGFSSDPANPDYGTHDWLAHHALDLVPNEFSFWIRNNLAIYLYGTELPDNRNAPLGDGIGDTTLHHIYYHANGQLQDNSSARRARDSYQQALSYLAAGDYRSAAKWLGITTHYISDVAVFGHVMGKKTDWGEEKHHQDYEDWVDSNTDRYDAPFNIYLKSSGILGQLAPYDAALRLAFDTSFDTSGRMRTAKWMDDNYNPNNPLFRERVGESLNLAVNLLADIIYSISVAADIPEFAKPGAVLIVMLILAIVVIRKRRSAHLKPESHQTR